MGERSPWWEKVDVSRLSGDARYRILRYVVERYGRKKVIKEAGSAVSRCGVY